MTARSVPSPQSSVSVWPSFAAAKSLSSPAPPFSESTPGPAWSQSLSSPPETVSLPGPAHARSFPAPPSIASLPEPPKSQSWPAEAGQRVVAGEAEQDVAALGAGAACRRPRVPFWMLPGGFGGLVPSRTRTRSQFVATSPRADDRAVLAGAAVDDVHRGVVRRGEDPVVPVAGVDACRHRRRSGSSPRRGRPRACRRRGLRRGSRDPRRPRRCRSRAGRRGSRCRRARGSCRSRPCRRCGRAVPCRGACRRRPSRRSAWRGPRGRGRRTPPRRRGRGWPCAPRCSFRAGGDPANGRPVLCAFWKPGDKFS